MSGCEIPKTIFVFYPQFQLQDRTGKSRSGMLFQKVAIKIHRATSRKRKSNSS